MIGWSVSSGSSNSQPFMKRNANGSQPRRSTRKRDGVFMEGEDILDSQEEDVRHLLGQFLEGSPMLGKYVLPGVVEASRSPLHRFLRRSPDNQRIALHLDLYGRAALQAEKSEERLVEDDAFAVSDGG